MFFSRVGTYCLAGHTPSLSGPAKSGRVRRGAGSPTGAGGQTWVLAASYANLQRGHNHAGVGIRAPHLSLSPPLPRYFFRARLASFTFRSHVPTLHHDVEQTGRAAPDIPVREFNRAPCAVFNFSDRY